MEEPYKDVSEAHWGLEALLAAFQSRADRRAVFLTIYSLMTEEVATRVWDDDFADSEWVCNYLVAFSNLYREAVYDYGRGRLDSLADTWQLAFEAAEQGDALFVQDAMLGVNAQINDELALAVDRVGVRPDPGTKYADHSQITDVISKIIDDAQDVQVDYGADGIDVVDESLGRFDEGMTVMTIDECRDSAWGTATAMNSRFRMRRRWAEWVNDVTATGAASLILSPQTSDVARRHW